MPSMERTLLGATAAAGAAYAAYVLYQRSKPARLTLGYWDIRGLAAPARMMCHYAGAACDFQDVTYALKETGSGYDNSAWATPKAELKKQNALMNLPYVVDRDSGLFVTQSTAVYQFIGRRLKLMGRNAAELAACEQVLAQALDLRNALMRMVYPFSGVKGEAEFKDALPGFIASTTKEHFEKLEAFLGEGAYFAGGAPTAADFHVFEMIDQHEAMAMRSKLPSTLTGFPKLLGFYQRVLALPQLQGYFASPAYQMPCNNKMANFK